MTVGLVAATAGQEGIAGTSSPAAGFIEVFDDRDWRRNWYLSNFDMGPKFVTGWREDLIGDDGPGRVVLSLEPGAEDKSFLGAEIQRAGGHHFGSYEVIMRPGRGDGLVSAFFTYTGPYFEDPHDEIDFEFLGRDTTRVWLNVFTAGKQLGGRWLELGFDAAAAPHLYRFEWSPQEIVWYVDGTELSRLTISEHPIPITPGRLFVNIWAGTPGMTDWLAAPAEDLAARAQVHCVSYRPTGAPGTECSDLPDGTWR